MRLGSTSACLDIDEAIERVGRVAEHAAEFEGFEPRAQGVAVGLDGDEGVVIVVAGGQVEEFTGLGQASLKVGQGFNDGFEVFLFATKFLGALRIIPDVGVF